MTALRPYQSEAVRQITKALATAERTQLVMACGTGKTLVAERVTAKMAPPVVVFAAPTILLLRQTMDVWAHEMGRKAPAMLAVCSAAEMSEHPTIDMGKATTKAAEIMAWLSETSGSRMIVTTHMSLQRVAKALPSDIGALLVVDEAHRVAGRKHSATSPGPFAHRLYMTATPRVTRRKDGEQVTTSMDNPTLFGDVAYTLPFAQAIEMGLLTDYRLHQVSIAESVETDETVVSTSGTEVSVGYAIGVDAAIEFMHDKNVRKALAYHGTMDMSEKWAKEINNTGRMVAFHADSRMTQAERRAVIAAFVACPKRAILSNCQLFAEGWDAPAVDAVILAVPKRSSVELAQIIGRAIRKHDGKDVAHILVPGGDDVMIDTIDALRDMDARFETALKADGGSGERRESALDQPAFAGLWDPEARTLAGQPIDTLYRLSAYSWWNSFEEVRTFMAEHGHLPTGNSRLGKWVSNQRKDHRRGRRSGVAIAALDGLDPLWREPKVQRQRRNAGLLRAWAAENNGRIPSIVSPGFERRLGNIWSYRYKHDYLGPWTAEIEELFTRRGGRGYRAHCPSNGAYKRHLRSGDECSSPDECYEAHKAYERDIFYRMKERRLASASGADDGEGVTALVDRTRDPIGDSGQP